MSNEFETRLEEAFAARAATTTTSDDAWARIQRRDAGRDHRRSVVLRSVAAAVVAVLAVGGGVALFRDRRGSGTVATGGSDASSKAVAEDRATSGALVAPEVAPVMPTVEPSASGVVVVFGDVRVEAGNATISLFPAPIPAAAGDGIVLGVVPRDARTVLISPSAGSVELFDDPSLPYGRIFIAREAPGDATAFTVEARDSSGQVVGIGEVSRG